MTTRILMNAFEEYCAAEEAVKRGVATDDDAAGRLEAARRRLAEALDETWAVAVGYEPRTFRRILVPVDGGPQATWAAAMAARLVAPWTGRLLLVHVAESPYPVFGSEVVYDDIDRVRRETLAAARRLLDGHVRELGATPVPVETRTLEGPPSQQIAAAAEDWHPDLIVMGAHARGRLASFVLGSTTQGAIHRVHCPVLVVAHDPAEAPGHTPGAAETVTDRASLDPSVPFN